MRDEISEPQHWRGSNHSSTGRNASWSSRRRTQENAELAAEAVDAALADETDPAVEKLDTNDIISSLASQLSLLEKQREQLQQLLVQAQAKS